MPPYKNKENLVKGAVVEGSVTGITHFGAFVRLSSGHDGLVHISEIADEFINDVNDFVKIGDLIKVKILGENSKGKFDLSIKQAADTPDNKVLRLKPVPRTKRDDFEARISHFLKRSEEKHIDLRRSLKEKQGGSKKKKLTK